MARNPRSLAILALSLAGIAGATLATGAAATTPERFTLVPCGEATLPDSALCGTYRVPENRSDPQSRSIGLRVVVVKATGPDRLPDPVVNFAGGPGDSAVAELPFMVEVHGDLLQRRDFVAIDLRGTGGSDPLTCAELAGERGVQGFLDSFLPVAGVEACKKANADRDLSQYRTSVAIDDVAEVLHALGYHQVNAWGGSYGTRSVLELIRRHPEMVRTAGLIGLVPFDTRSPLTFASDAQEALDGTWRECAADPACAKIAPDPAGDLAAVLARLDKEPVTVELRDPKTGERSPLRLTRTGFAQTVRYMLYIPSAAALLPLYVHAAAGGNFQPMGNTAALFGRVGTGMSDGFYLAITCAEDVAFIAEPEVAAATRGTFLGDFRIRAQQAACRAWGVPPVAREQLAMVTSDVPMLLFSGERDPVTPARWGEQVAKANPRAVHLVVPDGGHGFDGLAGAGCVEELLARLVELGDARKVDISCMQRIQRPPYESELPAPEVAIDATQRRRLVGSYAGPEGLEVVVSEANDHLSMALPNGKSFLLVGRAPGSFGLDGLPPSITIEVIETNGAVTALRLVGMADQAMVLERKPAP